MRMNSSNPLVSIGLVHCLKLELPLISIKCNGKVMRFTLLGTFCHGALVQIEVDRAFVLIFPVLLLVVPHARLVNYDEAFLPLAHDSR